MYEGERKILFFKVSVIYAHFTSEENQSSVLRNALMNLLVMDGKVKGRAGNEEEETTRTKWFCIIIKK